MTTQTRNLPIVEAACEFKFADSLQNLTVYGELYEVLNKKLNGIFTKKKTTSNMDLVFVNNEEKVEPRAIERKIQQFLTEDEKLLVQVGSDMISINKISPYESWEGLLPTIEIAFGSFIEVAQLKKIRRIGLRYINKIGFKEEIVKLKEYFSFGPSYNEKLGTPALSLFTGIQIPKNQNRDMLKIVLSTIEPEKDDRQSYLLDIDYFTIDLTNISPTSALEWIFDAHDEVNKAFSLRITDRLKERFEK